MSQLTYCGSQARLYDFDRYLCSLFAPKDKQHHLWALLAFQAEIATIKDKIREPLAGQVRLQWWRDRFSEYPNWQTTPHPILKELLPTISLHQLPLSFFHHLIDVHEISFDSLPFPDQQTFEEYCIQTNLPLLQLMSQVLNPSHPLPSNKFELLARTWGTIGLWRSIPHALQRGSCPLPLIWLKKVGLSPDTLLSPQPEHKSAHQFLGQVLLDNFDLNLQLTSPLPIALQAYMSVLYYKRFKYYHANLLEPKLYQRPILLGWRLLIKRILG